MDERRNAKIVFSIMAGALLIVHGIWPKVLGGDALSISLLILAALPWLDSLIKTAELPGGWKIEFREVKAELARQQDIINALVKFSMSASIFNHLCGIALLHRYNYVDNDGNRREMYFLRDNGLIRPVAGQAFVDFNAGMHDVNLAAIAEPTPIGWECIKLRLADIPENMRTDESNLRVREIDGVRFTRSR